MSARRRPVPEDFAQQVYRGLTREGLRKLYGASWGVVTRWLDDCRLVARKASYARRCGPLRANARGTTGIGDALYRRIERLVPLYFAADIRADIISDLYVAVLDGTIRDEDLEACGGSIMNRTINECGASRFGPTVSLDEEIGEDGWTRGHVLPDPAALAAFDQLFEGAIL